jgi:Xaa-Pro aminopeptidase
MGADANRVSFVGHGLGLEVDEPPFLARRSGDIVDEGTVFALEPKFVFADHGAVGIENTYIVGENGVECVTVIDEDLIEV